MTWQDQIIDAWDYDDEAFRAEFIKPAPEPVPEPEPSEPDWQASLLNQIWDEPVKKYDILGGIEDIGKLAYDVPINTVGAVASFFEDDNPEAEYDWKDIARRAQEERNKMRLAEVGGEEYVLPWIQRKDIRQAGASAGFSGVAMAAGMVGYVAGLPVPLPGSSPAMALAASGTAAYYMDKAMFTQQIIDAAREVNPDITSDEVTALVKTTKDIRSNHALWEAIPEAVGNLAQMTGIGTIVSVAIGKKFGFAMGKKIFGALLKMYGIEITTEMITQIGQHNAEISTGITEGDRRSLLSLEDLGESLKEVGPQTFVLVSLMGGGAAVGGKAYSLSKTDIDITKEVEPEAEPEVDLTGLHPRIVAAFEAGEISADEIQDMRDILGQFEKKLPEEAPEVAPVVEEPVVEEPEPVVEAVEPEIKPVPEPVTKKAEIAEMEKRDQVLMEKPEKPTPTEAPEPTIEGERIVEVAPKPVEEVKEVIPEEPIEIAPEVIEEPSAIEPEAVEEVKEPVPKVEKPIGERQEAMNKKYSLVFGTRIESDGNIWELVATNDLGIPYFSKVIKGKVQKKQFTISGFKKEWLDEQIKLKPTPEVTIKGKEAKFVAKPTTISSFPLTLESVKLLTFAKRGKVVQHPDDTFSIVFPNNRAFHLKAVHNISDMSMDFLMSYGGQIKKAQIKAQEAGRILTGIYTHADKTARIFKRGDRWTIGHEFFHFLEESGLLTKSELDAIDRQAISFNKGTRHKGSEGRARWVDHELETRGKARESTIGKIIQKIQDIIDSFINLVGITTAKGAVRGVETGKIAERGLVKVTAPPSIRFSTKELSASARLYLEKYYPEQLTQYDKQFKPADVDIIEPKAVEPQGWEKELFGAKKKSYISKVIEKIDDVRKNWRTRVFDRLDPIKTLLGDTAYMLHRLETGIEGVMATFMRHGLLKWDGKAITVDTNRKGFLIWYQSLKEDGNNLLYWIAAKRAEQLEVEDRENWLTLEQRDRIFESIGEPKGDKSWETLHKEFNEFNKGILDLAEQAGLIDPVRREVWEQDFYVPFYRIFEDEVSREEYLRGPAQSKRHIDANIRRLMGADRKLGDPLENVIRNWTHLIHESMRNMARAEAFNSSKQMNLDIIDELEKKDLVKILGSKVETRWAVKKEGGKKASKMFGTEKEAKGYAEFLKDKTKKKYNIEKVRTQRVLFGKLSDHNILTFQRKGERVYFRVNDPELFNALSNVNNEAFDNTLMKMFRLSKKALTYGATFGPAFRISNFARDTLHTALISKSFIPFIDSMKGFVSAMKEDQDFVKFAASGAAFGSSYVRADDAQILAQFIKRTTKREGKGVADRILDTPRKLLAFWDKVGSASENAARVSLYKTRIKEQKSHLEAAFESRDLLDFTMKGDAPTVQFLIQMVPFMNARMQGMFKLGRAAAGDPLSFGVKGATLAAVSILLWSFNKDREEWKALEDWDKWTYYHVWIGEDHYRIPKPFEVGAIFSTAFETTAEVLSGNEEIDFLVDALQHTFLDTFALNPIPQLVKPAIEQWANKSFFTGRPIESVYLQGLSPGERSDQWTSEILKLAGKHGIPPKRAQALIEGYFSTIGALVLGTADSFVHHLGDFPVDPEKSIQDYPFIGRFLRETAIQRNTKYSKRFYEAMKEMDELIGDINKYKKLGDLEKVKELRTRKLSRSTLSKLNKYRIRLRKLNAKVRSVYYSKTLSPEEKRIKLDEFTIRRNDLTKRAYDIISGKTKPLKTRTRPFEVRQRPTLGG